MKDWLECYTKKYAVFSGRARRKEYWMFILFNYIASFIMGVVVGLVAPEASNIATAVAALVGFLPSWAVFARRMHDIGKSGWWWLIGLVPLIGGIVLLVFMCKDSQPGDNAYGPNPKGM